MCSWLIFVYVCIDCVLFRVYVCVYGILFKNVLLDGWVRVACSLVVLLGVWWRGCPCEWMLVCMCVCVYGVGFCFVCVYYCVLRASFPPLLDVCMCLCADVCKYTCMGCCVCEYVYCDGLGVCMCVSVGYA